MADLVSGRFLLWVAWDGVPVGAAITQIADYESFKALRIVALGGEHFRWKEEADRVFDVFCHFHGLKRVEFYGRKGWLKRLPNYTLNRIMMTRDI